MLMTRFVTVTALAAFAGLSASVASASITIPTVPIGNPGNAADASTGFGSVAYTYNIGTTEVTNEQYTAFLNAVAATDPNGLYNTSMAGPTGGITRSGADGSYTYATANGRGNHPVNFVSFQDSVRFTNWLHNGQPTGPQSDSTTETGAYAISTDPSVPTSRNANWQWALPNENEWYKAAYHQPASQGGDTDDYWLYPTSSNTITTAQANYGGVIGGATPVGTYAANFYGVYDMAGNIFERTDTLFFTGRRIMGGNWGTGESFLQSIAQISGNVGSENPSTGFRVVQVPAPSAMGLVAVGGLLAARRRHA
ncbi:MAG: formylglycine-generating enzyme family protein [Phycisphaerales bacterium]|nr:formylglycine-generating enzyme family protein [Phycisphaerales bacterium]